MPRPSETLPSSTTGAAFADAAIVASAAQRSLFAMIGATLHAAWQPAPVAKPEVDPGLAELTPLERITEVLRYKLLQLEYSLSSGGGLRAWLRLNLLVCLLLTIPAILIVPVVTWLLQSFTTWSAYLFATALNLLFTLLTIVAIVGAFILLLFTLSALRRIAREQRRRR